MIQRIQTLYMFIGGISAMLGALILPLYAIDLEYIWARNSMLPFALFSVAMVLFSGGIMLYKNRKLQLLVVRIAMLVSLGIIGSLLLEMRGVENIKPAIGGALPLIQVIAAFMASKGIQKDEKLVRSTDRLR